MDVRHFDKTVEQIFRHKSHTESAKDSVIGLEFENETVEGFDLPRVQGWKFHQENSLRDFGFEYVLDPPKPLDEALAMTAKLFERLKTSAGKENKFSNSIRTSTHVHFDVTKFKFNQLLNFVLVYWILEDFLSSFCGEHRKGNLFCLRLKESSYFQSQVARAISLDKVPYPSSLTEQSYRYGSLNFASIPKFGSLEFRLMRGVDNAEEATLWVKCLDRIKQFSLNYDTPLALKAAFIKDFRAGEFPEVVLGEDMFKTMNVFLPSTFSITKSIRSSFLDLNNIFASHETFDWETEAKNFVPPKKSTLTGFTTSTIAWDDVVVASSIGWQQNGQPVLEQDSSYTQEEFLASQGVDENGTPYGGVLFLNYIDE